MSFEEMVPGKRGLRLKAAILSAFARVYAENVARYDPDGIGDDPTTFGLTVSRNLWHLLEVAVLDIPGVTSRRAHNTFFLVVAGADGSEHELYFCKAPPAARTVRAVSFEDSYVRSKIARRNGDHVQLRIDVEHGTNVPVNDGTPAPYAVIVHFGGPEDGYERAVAGVPYRLGATSTTPESFGWEWEQPLEVRDDGHGDASLLEPTPRPDPNADSGGFGLKLREVREDDDAAEDRA